MGEYDYIVHHHLNTDFIISITDGLSCMLIRYNLKLYAEDDPGPLYAAAITDDRPAYPLVDITLACLNKWDQSLMY